MPLAFAVDQRGILPDHMIAALAQDGAILPAYDFVPDQIQPASLDLQARRSGLSRARELLAGSAHDGRRAHRRTQAARDRARRRRGARNQLRLHRAADRKPRAARRRCRRRQSQELDRPARRLHPRDRRRDPRLRPHQGAATTVRSMPRSARAPFRCWCARARGCRKSASATAMRCSMPKHCARCTRASAWSTTTMPT